MLKLWQKGTALSCHPHNPLIYLYYFTGVAKCHRTQSGQKRITLLNPVRLELSQQGFKIDTQYAGGLTFVVIHRLIDL